MGTISTYNFGKVKLRHNTFIGGVAASFSTPELVATALSISAQRVRLFEIRGNDIRFCVIGEYTLGQDIFWNTPLPYQTYFLDKDGNINGTLYHPFRLNGGGANPMKFIDFKGVKFIDRDFLSGAVSVLKYVRLDSLISHGQALRNFTYMKNCKLFIPSLQVLGLPNVNEGMFEGSTNSIIYAHPFLATCNDGQPDADLVAAVAAGNTVVYVLNQSKPERITDLSIGIKTGTTAQILFTNPASANTLQEFEVSIDGVVYQNITASGQYITGLTAGVDYKNITVRAIDIYYNRADDESNEVSLTLVAFQVEIQAAIDRLISEEKTVLSNSKLIAYDELIKDIKTADINLWNSLKYFRMNSFNDLTGSDLSLINLKNQAGGKAIPYGGAVYTLNGWRTAGVNGYLDTSFNINQLSLSGFSIIRGFDSDYPANPSSEEGVYTISPTRRILISPAYGLNGDKYTLNNTSATYSTGSNNGIKRLNTYSLVGDNKSIRRNNLATTSVTSVPVSPIINGNYYENAANSSTGGVANHTSGTSFFIAIGSNITDAQHLILVQKINIFLAKVGLSIINESTS